MQIVASSLYLFVFRKFGCTLYLSLHAPGMQCRRLPLKLLSAGQCTVQFAPSSQGSVMAWGLSLHRKSGYHSYSSKGRFVLTA